MVGDKMCSEYMRSFERLKSPDKLIDEKKRQARFRRDCRFNEFYVDDLFDSQSAKMVFRSAYQRYFKSPKWDDFSVQEYQQKMQYRVDRRSVEHQHQPWIWESDVEDEDIEEIESEQDDQDRHIVERPPLPREREDRRPIKAWLDKREDAEDRERENERVSAPSRPQEELKPDRRQKDATYHITDNGDQPRRVKPENKRGRKPHRSPERRRRKETRRTKRSESPSRRSPSRSLEEKLENPPFLPYGWANDGPTEFRKTHNVLASQPEVYPAALRAAKRRQHDIDHKVKAHEIAIKRKELLAPPVAEDIYPKGLWATEYQRNFCRPEDIERHFAR